MPDLGDLSVKSLTILDGGTIRTQDGTEFLRVSPSVARIVYAPVPSTSDGAALGSATLQWSDLFLASGAVLNFSNGNVTITHSSGALAFSSAHLKVNGESLVLNNRTRVTVAEMNNGKTLLAAVAGLKYRLIDVKQISVGGAMAATANATGTAIYGTQSASAVALYTVLLAAGTQSTACYPGLANTSILANGASFAQNDAATAITCRAVTAGNYDLITATHFDVNLTYALEA